MTSSEINRVSGRIFEGFLSQSWVCRSQEDQDDYGIDFEIEQIEGQGSPAGNPFKVQLKGVERATVRRDGTLTFSRSECKKFRYYIDALQIPLVFVVCDLDSRRCFWVPVQGNRKIEIDLAAAQKAEQETFTLEFLPSNELHGRSSCQNDILDAVTRMSDVIALRRVEEIPVATIEAVSALADDPMRQAKKIRRAGTYAILSTLKSLFKGGRIAEAELLTEEVFHSKIEELDTRLHAGRWLLMSKRAKAFELNPPELTQLNHDIQLEMATQMLQLARSKDCPWTLRFYHRCFWRCSLMARDSHRLQSLFISEGIQLPTVNWFNPTLRARRELLFDRISRCFTNIFRDLNAALDQNELAHVANVWSDCARASKSLADACYAGGKWDNFLSFRETLDRSFPLAVYLSRCIGQPEDVRASLLSCCVQYLGISNHSDLEDVDCRITQLNDVLEAQVEREVVDAIRGELTSVCEKVRGYAKPENQNFPVSNKETKIFLLGQVKAQAAAHGIDIEDQDSEEAALVRLGLKDLDPTRVLRNCVHMHVTPISIPMIGQLLGLTTAGSKKIHCLKHGHAAGGLELDQTYALFRDGSPNCSPTTKCCSNCSDIEPHEKGWEWDPEWHQQQHSKFVGKRIRPRSK